LSSTDSGTASKLNGSPHDGEGVGFREMVEAQRRTGGSFLEKSLLEPSAMNAVPSTGEKVHALANSDGGEDEPEPNGQ
jgi:hypothetical protein